MQSRCGVFRINNTGDVDVIVTPKLSSSYNGDFFSYIYVRVTPGNDIDYKVMGEFNITIVSLGKKCLYFRLDMSNYNNPVYRDVIGHNTNITINAVPQ